MEDTSFPGWYIWRIKYWLSPNCNDREETHILRELAKLLEKSFTPVLYTVTLSKMLN